MSVCTSFLSFEHTSSLNEGTNVHKVTFIKFINSSRHVNHSPDSSTGSLFTSVVDQGHSGSLFLPLQLTWSEEQQSLFFIHVSGCLLLNAANNMTCL